MSTCLMIAEQQPGQLEVVVVTVVKKVSNDNGQDGGSNNAKGLQAVATVSAVGREARRTVDGRGAARGRCA